ncbi:hypothetical protein Tco_0854128 [Tanacetum coccineum]
MYHLFEDYGLGYKHSQLKSKSYNEIQKLFDKEMKKVNTFVEMNSDSRQRRIMKCVLWGGFESLFEHGHKEVSMENSTRVQSDYLEASSFCLINSGVAPYFNELEDSKDEHSKFRGGLFGFKNDFIDDSKSYYCSGQTTTIDELTLAQTLIEIKAAKHKAVTTAATTTATTRPNARGVVVQEPSEFKTTSSPSQASQLPQAKDKGKTKLVKPEKPLKKKDQITLDEEVARNLEAQLQAELEEEEERLARQKKEEAIIALIESWDNTQPIIEADRLLVERLQTREQEELTDEEKARLFVDLLEKRKKHFAALRAKEKRNKPPTKAQKKKMTRVNMLVDMDTEMKEGSNKAKTYTTQESSSKRTSDELEQEKAKKQNGDDD